jgi:hypothetical protein
MNAITVLKELFLAVDDGRDEGPPLRHAGTDGHRKLRSYLDSLSTGHQKAVLAYEGDDTAGSPSDAEKAR